MGLCNIGVSDGFVEFSPLDRAVYPLAPDLMGQKFGRWTVVGHVGLRPELKYPGHYWRCVCECGSIGDVLSGNLTKGCSRSCGCLAREESSCRFRTHGKARTPEQRAFYAMHGRCRGYNESGVKRYLERGIEVCERWSSFPAFYADVGDMPPGKDTLDRIDNDGGYWCGKSDCPECGPLGRTPNCRWASRKENANNRSNNVRIPFNGESLTSREWSERTGLPARVIDARRFDGWTPERILTTPHKPRARAVTNDAGSRS